MNLVDCLRKHGLSSVHSPVGSLGADNPQLCDSELYSNLLHVGEDYSLKSVPRGKTLRLPPKPIENKGENAGKEYSYVLETQNH